MWKLKTVIVVGDNVGAEITFALGDVAEGEEDRRHTYTMTFSRGREEGLKEFATRVREESVAWRDNTNAIIQEKNDKEAALQRRDVTDSYTEFLK